MISFSVLFLTEQVQNFLLKMSSERNLRKRKNIEIYSSSSDDDDNQPSLKKITMDQMKEAIKDCVQNSDNPSLVAGIKYVSLILF